VLELFKKVRKPSKEVAVSTKAVFFLQIFYSAKNRLLREALRTSLLACSVLPLDGLERLYKPLPRAFCSRN
jgi:hypothetical protein